MSLAVVVIASEKRRETTFPCCLESVREQHPDEIVVVADFPVEARGVRSLVVAPMLRNTVDALVKRDVGWVATLSKYVMYLCDDHVLAWEFVDTFRSYYEAGSWDMLAPSRFVIRDGQRVELNMGRDLGYIGGHGGIYRRHIGRLLPWSTVEHHPNWDVLHTHRLKAAGARLAYADHDLAIEDIEGGTPWL